MINAPTKHQSIPAQLLSRFSYLLLLLLPLAAMLIFPSLCRASGTGIAAGEGGDAERGKLLFDKRCAGCHSLDHDKEGPRLHNIYGSKAGTTSTFKYSTALKSAQITWNEATLDKWLTDPDSLVPDTDMDFHVPKPDERADIIRFLRVASGK